MSDPLQALRVATGHDLTGSTSDLPNIPAVPLTGDASVVNFMAAVKAWLEKAAGTDGAGFVTKQDLSQLGLVKNNDGTYGPIVAPSSIIPPVPTGLTASGAVANIILQWDEPTAAYGNHAYAEIWASGDASFSNALLVGQSSGFMFAHTVGDAATRYYWVRFVSTSDIKGPFSSVSGTPSSSSVDPQAVFDALHQTGVDNPFFTLTVPTVINGVTVPAGTYIKEAYIADATVSNAMIRDAAIDSAKIANLAVVEAKIQDAAISSAKIANAAILTAKIADAQITGAKIDTATIVTANIANAAITTAKIGDAAVDTLQLAGNAVTIPVSASGTSTATTASSDFEGGNVVVIASGYAVANGNQGTLSLYKDGSLVKSVSAAFGTSTFLRGFITAQFTDSAVGVAYYTATLAMVGNPALTYPLSVDILALGTKR